MAQEQRLIRDGQLINMSQYLAAYVDHHRENGFNDIENITDLRMVYNDLVGALINAPENIAQEMIAVSIIQELTEKYYERLQELY